MSIPVRLVNGKEWKNKSKAKLYFREMLNKYSDNSIIDNDDDHQDLSALLLRYDECITDRVTKIGPGIKHFMKKRNFTNGYWSSSFWVCRIDGTETDFSYSKAIEGFPESRAQEFSSACRSAIQGGLRKAKERFFETYGDEEKKVQCEVTKELIEFSESKLTHAEPPFRQIVIEFREENNWLTELPQDLLSTPRDEQTEVEFTDEEVAESFRLFHQDRANLYICKSRCNQKPDTIIRPISLKKKSNTSGKIIWN